MIQFTTKIKNFSLYNNVQYSFQSAEIKESGGSFSVTITVVNAVGQYIDINNVMPWLDVCFCA